MAFWSGETIRKRLSITTLIDKPDVNCIDGAAYTLKVGPEYYVSPTELDSNWNTRTVKTLGPGEAFTIPAGQFALVLTEEIVKIPINALGLFSIRSRVKWKGLVNVSGFHIDPGFWGRLTIAVYNAGPTPIHLRRGAPEFLVWFADLDAYASEKDARHPKSPVKGIDVSILNQAPGVSESLQGLSARIKAIEQFRRIITWVGLAVATAAITLALRGWYESMINPAMPPPPSAASAPQTPVAPSQAPVKPQP